MEFCFPAARHTHKPGDLCMAIKEAGACLGGREWEGWWDAGS